MIPKHKVFLSFHDKDLEWKKRFELLFHRSAEVVVSGPVQDTDIPEGLNTEAVRQRIRDEHLRDSTVTIVLIGSKTWQRKHVDWEISSSLRDTIYTRRSGLIGILLPDFPMEGNRYFYGIVPPRLFDNTKNGFTEIYKWTENPQEIKEIIHDAFLRRDKIVPDNSRGLYGKNRTTQKW